MNDKMNFIWIDDSPDREKSAKNLATELGVEVLFVGVKNKPIDTTLKEIVSDSEPDLIIMDHSLIDAISDTYKTGSTAAAFIREEWPHCPIISMTGQDINNVDIRHRAAYESMYSIEKISEHYGSIQSIARGFKEMKEKNVKTVLELIDLFDATEEDKEKIRKILPKELKENFNDKSLLLEIYRWCNTVFFVRPGFLYNRQWSAILLGLTPEGFKIVEENFSSAKYSGIFSNSSDEKWWKSKLLNILGEMIDEIGLPWEIGRNLVEGNSKYFSKCFASNEELPETVAAEDETRDAHWYPMKLKHTEPHPNFEDMLFFEELRIMKPA